MIFDRESHKRNDFDSDTDGLINVRKTYQNNGLIGYIKINSLREKNKSKRDIIISFHRYIMCWRNKTRWKFPWISVQNISVLIPTNYKRSQF